MAKFTLQQSFDYFDRLDKPGITLCNPDYTEIYSLDAAYDVQLKLKWNAQSELSFTYPRTVDETDLPAFDYIESKRAVKVEGIGYFIISDPTEGNDGTVPIKNVTCLSHESDLVYKKILAYTGTYTLAELLDDMFEIAPNWSLDTIETSLSSLSRTFDVSDTNIYQFLVNDVATAFNCVFIFDYEAKEISVVSADSTPAETDIFLSFDNLIKSTEYKEISSEITTCLFGYGGGDLTLRSSNPLGTNAVYNFDYYKDSDWMSAGLITALDAWGTKLEGYQSAYSASAVELADLYDSLTSASATLTEYQSELNKDNLTRDARIQQGLSTTAIDAEIADDEENISSQNLVIGGITDDIADILVSMSTVNAELAFTNTSNFTASQYTELNNFIFENTYKNDNIITTSVMTNAEVQEQCQALYDATVTALAKLAVPRYQITIDSANFIAMSDYSPFVEQMRLGDQITVDTGKGTFLEATLLEYDFNYDNPDDFTLILSNRNRIDDSHFILSDLIGQSVQTSTMVKDTNQDMLDWRNSKNIIINRVITPSGVSASGLVASNLKGTITANGDLSIVQTNSTTGSSNFDLSAKGLTIRDAAIYSGSSLGIDADITTSGGGTIYFKGGIMVGTTGIDVGSTVSTYEDLTGQTGTNFTVSNTYLTGSLRVYVNGVCQMPVVSFTENPDLESFTMLDPILSGDVLGAEYISLT